MLPLSYIQARDGSERAGEKRERERGAVAADAGYQPIEDSGVVGDLHSTIRC
jgi:hypothetical protein